VAGTVAMIAALAVTTLVFLASDGAKVSLAGVAPAVAKAAIAPAAAASGGAAAASPKLVAAAAAPEAVLATVAEVPKVAVLATAAMPANGAMAGKGTTKMSDNWKINENVPALPTYSDLEREVQELQKAETKHFDSRAASVASAVTSATTDSNKAGIKAVKWKSSKDQYEQAAYKDIMDEEKERIADSITDEGAKMFQQYEKKAQSLMGTDELHKLQNSTEVAEKLRSMREKSALIALKSANAALQKVEAAQTEAREEEDRKKQMRANAKMAAHLQSAVDAESGSKQYYQKVAAAKAFDTKRVAEQKKLVDSYKSDRQALKARDTDALLPKHSDTRYHRDYLEARKIENRRDSAMAKEIQQVSSCFESREEQPQYPKP